MGVSARVGLWGGQEEALCCSGGCSPTGPAARSLGCWAASTHLLVVVDLGVPLPEHLGVGAHLRVGGRRGERESGTCCLLAASKPRPTVMPHTAIRPTPAPQAPNFLPSAAHKTAYIIRPYGGEPRAAPAAAGAPPRALLFPAGLTSSSVLVSMSRAMSARLCRPYFSHARTKALKSRRIQLEKPSPSSWSRSAAVAIRRGALTSRGAGDEQGQARGIASGRGRRVAEEHRRGAGSRR